ncbi:MAG TPA: hypothetical protein VNH46_08770, partial [Gemmatimonadales bacterium]|nr:hypothetical protein [Gemmatimonadales bacterium]
MTSPSLGLAADRPALVALAVLALLAGGCSSNTTSPHPGPVSFTKNPCAPDVTVSLAVAQADLVDCSNGGATVTLAGNGASYLIVPQFASD